MDSKKAERVKINLRWEDLCTCSAPSLATCISHFKHHSSCVLSKYGVRNWDKKWI